MESLRLTERTLHDGSEPRNNVNDLFDVLAQMCHGRVVNATKLMKFMYDKKYLSNDEVINEFMAPSGTVRFYLIYFM